MAKHERISFGSWRPVPLRKPSIVRKTSLFGPLLKKIIVGQSKAVLTNVPICFPALFNWPAFSVYSILMHDFTTALRCTIKYVSIFIQVFSIKSVSFNNYISQLKYNFCVQVGTHLGKESPLFEINAETNPSKSPYIHK